MVQKTRRDPSFNLPLTPRLVLALGIGAIFVSFVVTRVAQSEAVSAAKTDQRLRVQQVARSLASRAAPLLEAKDDLRLSMMGASAAQFGRYRVLVVDADGIVRIDTGITLGGQKMQILTAEGSFERRLEDDKNEFLAPAMGLKGLVGEVRLRFPVELPATASFSMPIFGGCLLACLTLLVIGGFISHHWTLRVREAVTTARRLARGELDATCERPASGVVRELQDGLDDLAHVLHAGAHQVEHSFLELAYQAAQVVERRGSLGHGERTWRYASILSRRLGLSTEECHDLQIAARLHDLGEIYEPVDAPDSEASKSGELDPVALHRKRFAPQRGADLLEGLSHLHRVAEIVRHHRECFDGSGFPEGLQGDRIPLGARILGIAEAYDQLTTVSYHRDRSPLSWPDALDELRDDRGRTFDPWLVDLFEEEIRRSPVPERDPEIVMVTPSGVAPYKATQIDPDYEPVEETTLYWGEDGPEGELEVFGGEDSAGGETP